MSKREFLQKLDEYLSYELPDRYVEKNLKYYSDYIDSEVRNGKSLKEVLDYLGDPQLIARTIIDAAEAGADGIPNTEDDVDFSDEMFGNERPYSRGRMDYGIDDEPSEDYSYTDSGRDNYGTEDYGDPNNRNFGGFHMYTSGGCFTAIIIFLFISMIFSFVGAALHFLSPILVPLCIVLMIFWLLGRRK